MIFSSLKRSFFIHIIVVAMLFSGTSVSPIFGINVNVSPKISLTLRKSLFYAMGLYFCYNVIKKRFFGTKSKKIKKSKNKSENSGGNSEISSQEDDKKKKKNKKVKKVNKVKKQFKDAIEAFKAKKKKPNHVVVGAKYCPVCMQHKSDDNFTRLSCGHSMTCNKCLIGVIDANGDDKIVLDGPKCPSCNRAMSIPDLVEVTNNNKKRLKALYKVFYNLAEQMKTPCPTPDCSYRFEPGKNPTRIECPECEERYCSHCRLKHNPLKSSCDRAREKHKKSNKEEELTEKETRECPQCHTRIYRTAGCRSMVCKRCNFNFCWDCHHAYNRCICYARNRVLVPRNENLR